MNSPDRFLGCLFGLACGDAVGTTVEFRDRGSFVPLVDMVGGGPFDLQRGEWTDDTSMALCLAESLIECSGFDAGDQMRRYVRWMRDGLWSVKGYCFDIGITTSAALRRFERNGMPYAGVGEGVAAGNGCIMRLAPVPMFFADDRDEAVRLSGESSRTTHGAAECVDACRLLGAMIVDALHGRSKLDILTRHGLHDLASERLNRIADGGYLDFTSAQIEGSSYVVDSLEAALWCFAHTESYEAAVLAAANLGDDADTTAAVCGQLAGAFYGAAAIPERWRTWLAMRDDLHRLAIALMH